jgi:hypothetical protein
LISLEYRLNKCNYWFLRVDPAASLQNIKILCSCHDK